MRQPNYSFALILLLGSTVLTCCLPKEPTQAVVAPLPQIELLSPASGTRVEPDQEIEIESRATDARGLDRIELWVDDTIYRVDKAGAQPTLQIIQSKNPFYTPEIERVFASAQRASGALQGYQGSGA